MLYSWDKSLETGNTVIDWQHQQLIEMLNRLIIANNEGQGPQILQQTLDFLTNYVVQHFHDEEELQIQYNYPRYHEHKKVHEEFKETAKNLTERMDKEGYSAELLELTISTMADWLIMHIKNDDLRLSIYIQQVESTKLRVSI